MTNDTIMVRIDMNMLIECIKHHPSACDEDTSQILEKIMAAFQSTIEREAAEFEDGRGFFEACLFEAL